MHQQEGRELALEEFKACRLSARRFLQWHHVEPSARNSFAASPLVHKGRGQFADMLARP
jgi:hypothetical protein